jgi:hypothetical protein
MLATTRFIIVCSPAFYLKIRVTAVALQGCQTWSQAERKENRLMVVENRVLRKIFKTERENVTGGGEKCTLRNLMMYSIHLMEYK